MLKDKLNIYKQYGDEVDWVEFHRFIEEVILKMDYSKYKIIERQLSEKIGTRVFQIIEHF